MRSDRRFAMALSMLLVSMVGDTAFAEDSRGGWGIQFRQDTFDKTVTAMGTMQEEGDGFDKANLFVACDGKGALAAFFQNSIISFEQTVAVEFRDGDASRKFVFTSGDIPHLGSAKRLSVAETENLIQIFHNAKGGNVAFRTGNKKGEFASIAADEVAEILKAKCK